MKIIVVMATGLIAVGCAVGDPANADWGPLAVISPQGGGGEARTEGTLSLEGDCLRLERPGDPTTLVWPADRTSWDADSRTVHFDTSDGETVTIGDGDYIVMSGGSTGEGEWASRIDWVAPPADECLADEGWFITDAEVSSDRP
jgi:hypothetical protein